jgi:hypothetical protein
MYQFSSAMVRLLVMRGVFEEFMQEKGGCKAIICNFQNVVKRCWQMREPMSMSQHLL